MLFLTLPVQERDTVHIIGMWEAHWVQSPPRNWPLVTTQEAHAVQKHTYTSGQRTVMCLDYMVTCFSSGWNLFLIVIKINNLVKVSLTSFALLGRCLDTGQPHILRLILDDQQADEGDRHTNHSRDWQYCPPAVTLGQHRGNNGAQAASQIHATGQNCPPCPKLRGLKPLTADKRKYRQEIIKALTGAYPWCTGGIK